MTSIQATRGRYQAEGSPAFFNFVRRMQSDGGALNLSGSSVDFPRGFYVAADSRAALSAGADASLLRGLRMPADPQGIALGLLPNALSRGFALAGDASAFALNTNPADTKRAAYLLAGQPDFDVSLSETQLARTLFFASAGATFALQSGESGFKSAAPMPAAGQPRPTIKNGYGGSDDTGGSFIKPQYVKHNSALKAHDLGIVSNLLTVVTGTIGSQAGTNTLFYSVETDGPAQLRIRNTLKSKYTAQYTSVGVLDSSRLPVPLSADGFAYRTDNHATDVNESLELFPAGVYYFTISSSQWQAIPFEVTLQVFRYRSLVAAASGTLQPYARIALVKLFAAATWTAPLRGTIPANITIKRLEAAASVSGQPSLTLSIMRGAAGGTLAPYGRLKQTHRLAGVISGANSNVATLSSAPPYGSGY